MKTGVRNLLNLYVTSDFLHGECVQFKVSKSVF